MSAKNDAFLTEGKTPTTKPVGIRYDIYVDLDNYREVLQTEINVKLSISDVIGKLLYDTLAER